MSTQKQSLDVAKSELEIDLGEIAYHATEREGDRYHFEYGADTDGEGKPEGHLQAHCRSYSSSASGVLVDPASIQRLRLATALSKSTVASSRVAE